MISLPAFLCLIAALLILIVLSIIDLRVRLLPNEWVAGLVVTGVAFHLATHFHYLAPTQMAFGAALGGGLLYIVRMGGNAWYREDALGLGDVKLMAAGGLWLGPDGILSALIAGALAALVHGLFVGVWQARREKRKPDFARLKIPAGPGFAVGLVISGVLRFWA